MPNASIFDPRVANAIRKQLTFLIELDRLKSIIRQSPLINRSRKENSAEHSWHLAMFALVLSEHAENVDAAHVVKLLLLHDVVEIDAGDFPIHLQGQDAALLAAKEKEGPTASLVFFPTLKKKSYIRCGRNLRLRRRPRLASPRPSTGCNRFF